jgi:serine/threonine protein phosphatase PrpC
MSLLLRAAAASDLGLVRTNNEDSVFAGARLLVVADGMGGLPAGELASDLAIGAMLVLEEQPERGDPRERMLAAFEAANELILAAVEAEPANEGMGTTLTALLLAGDRGLGLLHAGDSRCYLLRDGELRQVTRDDTFVQALVDEGVLTPQEARRHPRRSLITRALQGFPVTPTCELLTPRGGDRYLLCSDGLSDYVEDGPIGNVLASCVDPGECVDRLVKLTLSAGAPDNVSVVVADIVEA